MIIDNKILDELTAQAKASPRLRCNLDLRNSADDNSQRMLNAIEPGTEMPIHRHRNSSETCICVRGHFVEYFYDANGNLTDTIDMLPGGTILNIEKGQWHSLKSLESGTVLLEAKDGKWDTGFPFIYSPWRYGKTRFHTQSGFPADELLIRADRSASCRTGGKKNPQQTGPL